MFLVAPPTILLLNGYFVGRFGETIVELRRAVDSKRRVEKTLVETQGTAQKYLDIAGVMMLVVDRAGTITLLNRKGRKILGYDDGELIGRNWIDTCIPPRLRERVGDVGRR